MFTRIGAWETMLGVTVGTACMALTLSGVGSDTNPMLSLPFYWALRAGRLGFRRCPAYPEGMMLAIFLLCDADDTAARLYLLRCRGRA